MPRSPLAARLPEIRSPPGRLRENADLIWRQRSAKSASPSGSVEMIGQNHHCVDRERMSPPHLAKGVAQFVDIFGQQLQPSLRQIDSEKEAASGDEVAAIAGH